MLPEKPKAREDAADGGVGQLRTVGCHRLLRLLEDAHGALVLLLAPLPLLLVVQEPGCSSRQAVLQVPVRLAFVGAGDQLPLHAADLGLRLRAPRRHGGELTDDALHTVGGVVQCLRGVEVRLHPVEVGTVLPPEVLVEAPPMLQALLVAQLRLVDLPLVQVHLVCGPVHGLEYRGDVAREILLRRRRRRVLHGIAPWAGAKLHMAAE
mmetsp:Transcript_50661/g.156823  ORF Transcript_50661/g.156823 Transcript_50661/m.156823 type:complete len:208 (-) Transcript_50661:5-628(-)